MQVTVNELKLYVILLPPFHEFVPSCEMKKSFMNPLL